MIAAGVAAAARRARSRGAAPAPDRGALSGPLAAVAFVSGVGGAIALADAPYPRPGSSPADVRRYFSADAGAARLSAAGQIVSAVSLARFAVSVAGLAGRAGRRSRPLRVAAAGGGALAAASLGTAALCAVALTTRAGRDERRAVALHRVAFLAGGPVHGAGFGVLVGVLGFAGLRTGELPRAVALVAAASAVPNVLSPLYVVAEPAGWLIPIGRFPGLVVSAVAGARLGGAGR